MANGSQADLSSSSCSVLTSYKPYVSDGHGSQADLSSSSCSVLTIYKQYVSDGHGSQADLSSSSCSVLTSYSLLVSGSTQRGFISQWQHVPFSLRVSDVTRYLPCKYMDHHTCTLYNIYIYIYIYMKYAHGFIVLCLP